MDRGVKETLVTVNDGSLVFNWKILINFCIVITAMYCVYMFIPNP